jgi:hypothetical protein
LQGRCEWRPLYCGRSYETTLDEFDAYLNLSPQQVRATGNFGALPLEVVAHDPDFIKAEEPSPEAQRDEDIGLELQKELSRLSTRGCLQIAKGSGHYVYDARMDMALAAIREVVAEAKDPSHTRHGCET